MHGNWVMYVGGGSTAGSFDSKTAFIDKKLQEVSNIQPPPMILHEVSKL